MHALGASEAMGRWSLIQVTPASTRWPTLSARPTSDVHTELARPYLLSLARATASSSSSNGRAAPNPSYASGIQEYRSVKPQVVNEVHAGTARHAPSTAA